MAVPPSQRPRRVAPAFAAAKVQSPAPAMPLVVTHRPLIAILVASFCAFLILPSVGTLLLQVPTATGQNSAAPITTTTRIAAFFTISYGLWGLVLYTWACCQYSLTKGRSGWWGLTALLGVTALLALYATGLPVAGVFSILALAGIVIPLALGEDPLQRITSQRRIRISSGIVLFAAFGLFVGISFAYGNSFYGGMTLDNKYIIEEYYKTLIRSNPSLDVLSLEMLGNIFRNDYWWPKGISGLYRPLVTLSYWANYVYQDNKLDPFQFHVVNFFLHWLAAFLGFLLIRLLTKRDWIAFAAALLFVTHPIATESVSNIIGRADVIAACATFAGIVLYIHSTLTQSWVRWVYLFALMIVTLLGVFAKESAIAIVGVMVVYDVVYRWSKKDLIAALPTLLGLCVLGILGLSVALLVGKFGFLGLSEGVLPALAVLLVGCVIGAAVIVVVGMTRLSSNWLLPEDWFAPWEKFFIPYLSIVPPVIAWVAARAYVFYYASPPETPFLDNPIRGLNFLAARMTAMDVFVRLVGLLVWPLKLSCDYSFNQIPLFNGRLGLPETWIAFFGFVILLSLLALAVIFYKRQKAVSFLILFYLVVYLPTSNWLIIIGSIMAERFLYLPLLAFTACVVIGFDALLRRISGLSGTLIRVVLVALLTVAFSIRTWERNKDWLSDITLWASAIKVSPHSFRSYQSGAFALFEQLNINETAGAYKNQPDALAHDIDQIIYTAEQAKPIVDVLSPEENSSRLYLHLGMYYSQKGDFLASPLRDGLIAPDDPSIPWYRKAESVLQQGVLIDRTFNGVNRKKEIARKIKSESEIADVGLPPIYFYLGYDYAQLSEWSKALQSFQYMAHLDPADPDTYLRITTAELRQNRFEAAAASAIQALILKQDLNAAWPPLQLAFSKIQPDGPQAILVSKNNHLQLNLQTVSARSAMCSAYQNFVRSFVLAKREPTAEQFSAAAKNMGYPAPLFDDLLKTDDADAPVPPPAD